MNYCWPLTILKLKSVENTMALSCQEITRRLRSF